MALGETSLLRSGGARARGESVRAADDQRPRLRRERAGLVRVEQVTCLVQSTLDLGVAGDGYAGVFGGHGLSVTPRCDTDLEAGLRLPMIMVGRSIRHFGPESRC